MAYQFTKHYTRDEARALLPQIRQWLDALSRWRDVLAECENRVAPTIAAGNDVGGRTVNNWVRALAEIRDVLREFQKREIQIKDVDRGLIDFPAFVGGQEVFLCWEKDEEDIQFWHDLVSGYAGREPL